MADRVKERVEEVRSDERQLIAALRSNDPQVREDALIQMVVTVGRSVDDIGSRWSEWSAHYTEAREDIKALREAVAEIDARMTGTWRNRQPWGIWIQDNAVKLAWQIAVVLVCAMLTKSPIANAAAVCIRQWIVPS